MFQTAPRECFGGIYALLMDDFLGRKCPEEYPIKLIISVDIIRHMAGTFRKCVILNFCSCMLQLQAEVKLMMYAHSLITQG